MEIICQYSNQRDIQSRVDWQKAQFYLTYELQDNRNKPDAFRSKSKKKWSDFAGVFVKQNWIKK